MDLIDLHTHTTASDGSLTPAELVAAARSVGLKAVAITDHDTVAGLEEALAAGRRLGQRVVPGVEISLEGLGGQGMPASMHLLGLFVDHREPGLIAGLGRLQAARAERNPKIAEKLGELGIAISLDEVRAYAGGDLVGRPHFAQALVARGVVKNRGEAFARFLAAGKPAYVSKWRFPPAEGIAMLKRAGAVTVLAHPGLFKLGLAALEPLLLRLVEAGLDGVEAHYSEHDPALSRALARLAARLGLAVSGGSDFHGAPKPDIALGVGRGGLRVPASLLADLERRRAPAAAPPR
ncbi:MAG: PHP domain-containing protein [Thermodesulfobacteriota bacterium]